MYDPIDKYLQPPTPGAMEEEDPIDKYLNPTTPTDKKSWTNLVPRVVSGVAHGALDSAGSMFNTAGSAASGINRLLGSTPNGPSVLTNIGTKLKSWAAGVQPEEPANGFLDKAQDVVGNFIGSAIATAPLAGPAARIAGKALSYVPSSLTQKALQYTAEVADGIVNPVAKNFVSGAMKALPKEAIAGTLMQSAIDPESLTTPSGVAQAAGFAVLGAGITGYRGRKPLPSAPQLGPHQASQIPLVQNPEAKMGGSYRDFLRRDTKVNFPTHAPSPIESTVQRKNLSADPDGIANKVQFGPYQEQKPIYGPFPLSADPDPAAVYAYAKPSFVTTVGHGTAPESRRGASNTRHSKSAVGPTSRISRGQPINTDEALGMVENLMHTPDTPRGIVGTLVGAFDELSNSIERKFFNAKSAFRVIDKRLGNPEDQGLEATANLLSGNSGRIHGMIHDMPVIPKSSNPLDGYETVMDPVTKQPIKALKDVIPLIPNQELRKFGAFLHARHRLDPGVIEDIAVNGGSHPITEDVARLAVQNAPKHWQEAAGHMDALNRANLDYLHRSEVISNGVYDWLSKNYPSYVSLSRAFDKDAFAVPILRRKGSEIGSLRDPFQTYIENTIAAVNISEKNRFKKQLYEAALQHGDDLKDVVLVKPLDHSDIVDETLAQIQAAFKVNGISAPQSVLRELAIGLAPEQKLAHGQTATYAYVNGRKQEILINDDLAEAFKTMSFKAPDPVISTISKFEKIPRRLTSIFLDLTLRGPYKDWMEAYVNSASAPVAPSGKSSVGWVPLNPFKGLSEIRRRGQYFQELQREGGTVGNRFLGLGAAEMENNFKRIQAEGSKQGLKFNLQHPIQSLEALAADLSQSNRVALFMRMRDNGITARQAAIESRQIIPDPMQVGAVMRGFAQMTSFGNTGLQAINNYKRVFSQSKTPEFMVKGMVAHALPAATFWALARHNDDTQLEEIRRAPGNDKYMYVRNPFNKDEVITIPKGWGWSQVFGTGTEALLDKFFDNDPKAGKDLVKSIIDEVGINVIPLSVSAGIEAATGKKLQPSGLVTGEAVSRGTDTRGVDGYQNSMNTTKLSQAIGEKTGISPIVIDNGVRALLTSEGFKWVNAFGNLATGNKGIGRTQDLPEVGGWLRNVNQSTNTRSNAEFYKEVEKARNLTVTLSKLQNSGDINKWAELINKDPDTFAKIPVYGAFADQMSMFKQLIDMTEAMPNDSLSPQQKRKQIDGIIKQMNEYTHVVMKSMR